MEAICIVSPSQKRTLKLRDWPEQDGRLGLCLTDPRASCSPLWGSCLSHRMGWPISAQDCGLSHHIPVLPPLPVSARPLAAWGGSSLQTTTPASPTGQLEVTED